MESEDQDLLKLQEKLSESFMSLSYICHKLQKKSDKYVTKLKNNHNADVNIIQSAGIGLIHMMQMLKGNMSVLLNSLDNDVKEVDHKRSPQLLQDIFMELWNFKTSVVSSEKDTGYIFSRLCDKETMTEENVGSFNSLYSSTSDLDQTSSDNSVADVMNNLLNEFSPQKKATIELPKGAILVSGESDAEEGCPIDENNSTTSRNSLRTDREQGGHEVVSVCDESNIKAGCSTEDDSSTKSGKGYNQSIQGESGIGAQDVISISSESTVKTGCPKEENRSTNAGKKYNLSLRVVEGSDEQDTDDSWPDYLKFHNTVEVKTELPAKQEREDSEEDAYDMETVDLNYESDNPSDDIFEDGQSTPKSEKIKTETDMVISEESISVKEEAKSEFEEESTILSKSKEVNFSVDFKEELSVSIISEETDMIFSEDVPMNTTYPGTPENQVNGLKSSESATNRTVENPVNSPEGRDKSKYASIINYHDEKKECGELCEQSQSDSEKNESLNRNLSSRCNEDKSNDGIETVKCSNNDSQSPIKIIESGTSELEIPVETDESSNDSINSSRSSYTIDSTMQITKKSRFKSPKHIPSSQDIETPENSQDSESSSDRISNSQSSVSSDKLSPSFYPSSESTIPYSPTANLASSFEQMENSNFKKQECETRINKKEEDLGPFSLLAESQKSNDIESLDSRNEDDIEDAMANLANINEGTGNLSSIKCRDGKNKNDKVLKNTSSPNSNESTESPNLKTVENDRKAESSYSDDSESIDSRNEDEANQANIHKQCEDLNCKKCQDGRNKKDEVSTNSNEINSDEPAESPNLGIVENNNINEDENSVMANLSHSDEKKENLNYKRKSRRIEKDQGLSNTNPINVDDLARNVHDEIERLDERSNDDQLSTDTDPSNSKEPAVSTNLKNLVKQDNKNEGETDSAMANLINSHERTGNSNCEKVAHDKKSKKVGEIFNANLMNSDDAETRNYGIIESQQSNNEDGIVSTMANLVNCYSQPENLKYKKQHRRNDNYQGLNNTNPIHSDEQVDNTNSDNIVSEKVDYVDAIMNNLENSIEIREGSNCEPINIEKRAFDNLEKSDERIKNLQVRDSENKDPTYATVIIDNEITIDKETVVIEKDLFEKSDNLLRKDYHEERGEESESSDNEIYFQPTQKIYETSKIQLDSQKAETGDVIVAPQVTSDSKTTESRNADGSCFMSDAVNENFGLAVGNGDSGKATSLYCSDGTGVLNEFDDMESNAEISKDDKGQPNLGDVSIEKDLTEKEEVIPDEIENPFSAETVKLYTDEEADILDSQSTILCEPEQSTDFLNEHNYSCTSASDIDDSTKNGRVDLNPEIEDYSDNEVFKGGIDKTGSEIDIEDSESDSNLIPEAERNDLASRGPRDSNSDSMDIVDTSYIYTEHNYSSGGSPRHHNSSSDTEYEPVKTGYANESDGQINYDVDSDETDIDRDMNRDFVNETEDVKSIREKNLADIEEIPDSQEDVALSQQSTASYEFDISERVNRLGDLSDVESITANDNTVIDNAQEDEIGAEHIAKELECLLSDSISDNKSEDDPTDITQSDSDPSNANSTNLDTSSGTHSPTSGFSNSQITDDRKEVEIMKRSLLIRLTDCLGKNIGLVSDNKNIDKSVKQLVIPLTNCLKDKIGQFEQQKAENAVELSENEKEQAVLNDCNVESTESLLDIIMEEILSDCEKANERIPDSQETIVLDEDDIKPKLEIQFEENELEDLKPLTQNQNDIGDEILELLREVSIPSLKNADNTQPVVSCDIKPDEEEEAEDILKMMEQNTSDESSESDDTDEELAISIESNAEINDIAEVSAVSNNNFSQALAKHNMVGCYVALEKLQLPEEDFAKYTRKLEDNVDWLCDLTNMNKRKYDGYQTSEKLRSTKRIRKEHSSSNGTDSSTDSDIEVCGYISDTLVLPKPAAEKLDTFLADVICRDLNGGRDLSNDENEGDSDDSSKGKGKNKPVPDKEGSSTNKNDESDTDTNNEKEIMNKKDSEKKAWKHDPLLRGKLSSGSDSGSSNTEKPSKKRRKRQRYELDTEISLDLDSDTDLEGVCEKNKSKLEEKLISPIKRNIPSSDSSESDSDIEFVPQKVRTPLKDGEAAGPSPSQKGRRNIRALMSQESLAEATKKANLEERERIERLKDRHKFIESFSQSFNNSQSQDEDSVPFVLDVDEKTGEPLIEVSRKLAAKLKPHQKKGIQFMWDSCYESVEQLTNHEGSGCILAHCMGLGKTLQVIALVNTLFAYEKTNTKHVLVVCPLSTVNNWENEVNLAFNGIKKEKNFTCYPIAKKSQNKYEEVKNWFLRKKSMLVLGYENFETLTNESKLDKVDERTKNLMLEALIDPGPDLVICDEGHLLRNKNALKSLALSKVRTKRRIILTGTPLQNNLLEYYHMVHFVKPDLLGNPKEFKTNFVNPITNGQYEDSTEDDIKLMMKRTHVLHRLLVKTVQRIEDTELEIYLPKMLDHALFIQLHQTQVDLYNHFSEVVRNSGKKDKGFLSDFSIFQYICTHPHLLSIMEKMRNKRIKEKDVITNEEDPICNFGVWWKDKMPKDAANKMEYGNKLVVLRSIIEECEEIGDKVLVFSQSLGELELIEYFLKTVGTKRCPSWQKKHDYHRMDGTVDTETRPVICDTFNDTNNKRMRLLLMSTKVGGLGLNLTAANRVIIMTVNWNPSYDTQSVFRAYRFGQEKEVYVYRLISSDTMEEKVYHRTVTKLAVAHRVLDKHQITRHYQRMHLQELYSCKPSADEERPTPNVPEDQMLAKLILRHPCIFKYHEHKTLLANRPEENLSPQELASAWEAWTNKENETQVPPPPKTQGVPPPKAQGVPLQKVQGGPPQRVQGGPPQRVQGCPPQRVQGGPAQRIQGQPHRMQGPPQRMPPQINQSSLPERTQTTQPQNTPTTPPVPPLSAINYGVSRSNLKQLVNANLSNLRVSSNALDDELRQYFIPKKNFDISSSDLLNLAYKNTDVNTKISIIPLPSENAQSSSARNERTLINGTSPAPNFSPRLPPSAKSNNNNSKATATSKPTNQVVKEGTGVVGSGISNGLKKNNNLLNSPTVPVAKKIALSSANILKPNSNTPRSATGGEILRSSPLIPGLVNVHENLEILQKNYKMNPSLLNLPKGISVTKPNELEMERRLIPSPFSLGNHANARVNSGASPSNIANVSSRQTKANSTPLQKRLALPPSGTELTKKKNTNENSIPSGDRNNLLTKRKNEDIFPNPIKRLKSAGHGIPNKNRNIQNIVTDDIRKQRHRKRIGSGSSSDSRKASSNLSNDSDVLYDTSSESGSLSSEIINNLKLSGVTVRKSQSPSEVITLD